MPVVPVDSESTKQVVQLQEELAKLRQSVANGEGEFHMNTEWSSPDRATPYENPTPINASTLSSDEVMAQAAYAHMLIAELQKERDSVTRENPTSPRIANLEATIGVIEAMYANVFTEVAKGEAKSIEDRKGNMMK